MLLPGGAFITLGLLIGFINYFTKKPFAMGIRLGEDIGYREKGRFVTADDAIQTSAPESSPAATKETGQ